MRPPMSSAGKWNFLPTSTPMALPMTDMRNDVSPIIIIGGSRSVRVVMPMQVKLTPTARASMLVATDRIYIVEILNLEVVMELSSSLKWSITILVPMKQRRTNAIQWSIFSIYDPR